VLNEQQQRIKPTVFNVLFLGVDSVSVSSVLTYTEMLHDYLNTLGLSGNRIILHTAVSSSTAYLGALTQTSDCFEVHEINVESKEEILNLAKEKDIDVILDENEIFSQKEVYSNRDKLAIIHWYNPQFTDLINAICAGWGVVWNARNPVLNGTWVTKYLEENSLSKAVFDFMEIGKRQGYSEEQVGFIRSMTNKISQMNHAKQLLDYTIILQRHANRHGLKTENLLFEHSYHLNNYYVLMASTLDVFSRLINNVYQLGFSQFTSYTLDKAVFLKALEQKRKGLAQIIQLKKHLDWMHWMKQRRNLFAHQSHIGLTEIVQRKKIQLTEDELNQKVEDSMDWAFMLTSGIASEAVQDLKEFTRFQIDLEQNYQTIVKDIMTIDKQDRVTREVTPVVFFPLRAIDDDYKVFSELVKRMIQNLNGARKVK